MTPIKIKDWLKQKDQDRAWLAKQCGVSKKTVDGWLSAGRPIPAPVVNIITALMKDGPSVRPKFTLEQFSAMQEAARKEGKTLDEWTASAILEKLTKTLLIIFALFHLTRSPTDWSSKALLATGKAAISTIGRALA